jgi:hypothetical protein
MFKILNSLSNFVGKIMAKHKEKKHKKESPKEEYKEEHRKEKIKKAMEHPDKLGAGAKKRKSLHGKDKVEVVMKEFKRGTLRSGSGEKVTNPKQGIAIALSEAGLSKNKRK